MRHRCLNLLVALAVLFAAGGPVAAQAPTAAKGQPPTAAKTAPRLARTADGHPDLRGIWNYDEEIGRAHV